MEPDTSMASIMSMPLALTSVVARPNCGRANATTNSPSASRGSSGSQRPTRLRVSARHLASGFRAGKFDGGHRALAPTPEGNEREEKEQPQPTGLKKLDHDLEFVNCGSGRWPDTPLRPGVEVVLAARGLRTGFDNESAGALVHRLHLGQR